MMRALTSWRDPQVSTLHDEIDTLFDRFFGSDFRRVGNGGFFAPAIESFLRGDKLVVRADLPGIDPKKVDLSVAGDRLTIRGERKSVEEDNERHYREVSYGRFERTLQLPRGVDPDSVQATYHDGVLEVVMAAPKGSTTKKIPIDVH